MFPVLSRMAMDLISVQASSIEMCMCLKDHLDAKERKQDKCPLETPLDFEEDVFDDEVQRNEAIPLSDEEIALDANASSEGTLSPRGPRDLWKVCNDYGTVVDVFIPNKKSKTGKHFAFVRFIKLKQFKERICQSKGTTPFVYSMARVNQIVTIFLIEPSIHLLDHYRYPVDTSLIHVESRKSPTAELSDVDSERISILALSQG
uniref:RNA-directed DNA polymerase, eukaryota, nucleotide-binding alpha-beta plait domain protein n=1 Tax=Tanacetum cinerariifolium TaxID=118510 RepID=A0A6L2MI02_TANCI|nr:RNA-directed DNA polymerase, eukaryota, nucleotide-binding alpha-beta plait domain protein [Tanacetum cinerariifolium]